MFLKVGHKHHRYRILNLELIFYSQENKLRSFQEESNENATGNMRIAVSNDQLCFGWVGFR